MPRMIVTHAVKDADRWLAARAEAVEIFSPYATEIHFFTIPEGSNNVAIHLNVHDFDGMMAMTQTPEHQAFTEEAGVIHPPHAIYSEAAG